MVATLQRLDAVEQAMQKSIRLRKIKSGYAFTFPSEGFPEEEIRNLAGRYGATKVHKGYRFVAKNKASLYKVVFSFIYDLPVPTRTLG